MRSSEEGLNILIMVFQESLNQLCQHEHYLIEILDSRAGKREEKHLTSLFHQYNAQLSYYLEWNLKVTYFHDQ